MSRFNVQFEAIFKTIKALKDQGVPYDEVLDALEFDSDQYPNPEELQEARDRVYGNKTTVEG